MKSRSINFFIFFILTLGIFLGVQGPIRADQLEGRSYQVYLPDDYQQRRDLNQWPLVVLLHGFKASGPLQNAYLGLSKKVTAEQFILVVPDGSKDRDGNRFWNATPFCCDFYQSGIDDVGFIKNLIAKMALDYSVDKKKIHLFGHSNGAFMANRLACEIPDLIAGIITIAGTGLIKEDDCRVKGPVSVLHIHGTADKSIAFEGQSDRYPGALEMVDRWVLKNSCQKELLEKRSADLAFESGAPGEDKNETEVLEWNHCSEGKRVVLLKMNDVGHIPNFKKDLLSEVFSFIHK